MTAQAARHHTTLMGIARGTCERWVEIGRDLAAATGTDAQVLYRPLRALPSWGYGTKTMVEASR
jgi:hypothetical protein